jgi:hypothetical protein
MNLPPYLTGVPPNIKRWADQVVDAIRQLQPMPSPSLRVKRSANGWNAEVVRDRVIPVGVQVGGETEVFDGPWQIQLTGSIVKVTLGTINGSIATNWNAALTLPPSSVRHVVANVTTFNGAISTITLALEVNAPAPIAVTQGTPPVTFAVLVGIVTNLGGGVVHQVLQPRNVQANVVERFRTSKTNLLAGEFPLDIWYSWTITQP